MFRISVTDLDAFRRYQQTEDMSLDDFLAQLRRKAPPTPAILAGRALHSLLENVSEDIELIEVEKDGFRFYFHCPIDIALPPIRELKGELEIETPYGPATLVGVIDGMDGVICDYKLSGQFDAERFTHSYQWRAYLTIFGGFKFLYRVFIGQERRGLWGIWEYHELPFYRYPAIEDDVKNEVTKFARFLSKYGSRATANLTPG